MKILDLTNVEKSEIKYKISKFPDGQQNITILTKALFSNGLFNYDLNLSESKFNFHWNKSPVKIKARLNSFLDLELIICAIAGLRELDVKEIHLYTPYFLGARSDRKFENGGNWYLKQVLCPILNSLNLDSVTVLDAHSSVLGNLLNNYKAIDNKELVKWATLDICGPIEEKGPNSNYPFILVSPDVGASHKLDKIAQNIGYKGNIITCSKERDIDGNLTKTVVPLKEGLWEKDFIIIDDICDGGRTFINIAEVIKNWYKDFSRTPKIYLIVTHGIFSNGFEELNKYFDGIYCTNSFKNVGDYEHDGDKQIKTNVKQFKVL